jgi:glyoxylase-like metal-dependent hydrolase (beta-lactamase superfamily II)
MKKKTIMLTLSSLLLIIIFLVVYVFFGLIGINPIDNGKVNDHLYAAKTGYTNFFVWEQDQNLVCFDAGVNETDSRQALSELGIDPEKISHLFLTHTDGDHAGGLKAFPKAKIYVPKKELGVLDGSTPRRFFYTKGSNEILVDDYEVIADKAKLQVGSIKIEAISTPGHSPGSTSYLVNDSVLFVGDALQFSKNNALIPLFSPINNDSKLASQSIKTIEAVNASLIVSAHAGFKRK